ncbi:MAG: hypothetical protein KKC39_00995 [Candidatus Omnitrophica bacterium]|nr:hypothetical protein [Candidatus Omnitrophota bacterium]MCG2707432.1 hypothetical protein [Candidatus Omnitrophota bacterium]
MISDKKRNSYLAEWKNELLKEAKRKKMDLSKDLSEEVPCKPGVYAVFEKSKLVYVGETGNILKRIKDIRSTYNHQLRRNIGKHYKMSGYRRVNSKTKFPAKTEKQINDFFENKFKFSYLVLKLGRKELEESIYDKHKPKYNKKGRRK